MTKLNIFSDGGSRGNPGEAACAFVIKDEKENILYQDSKYLGIATNNVAEYQGLKAALNYLLAHEDHYSDYATYQFHLDSELVVKQINGLYKVKDANMQIHYLDVKKILSQLKKPYVFIHVPRSSNQNADTLLNLELDNNFSKK